MKANKLVIRLLVLLGFGGTVGLAGGCSASRVQKNRSANGFPAADTVVVPDGDVPVSAMYGVPPVPFDENRTIGEPAQ